MRTRTGKRVQIEFNDESLTQQHFKDMVDPKMIMERYLKTGLIDPSVVRHANTQIYGDASEIPTSYEQALEVIRSAGESYAQLPESVRNRYGDAEEFVRQTGTDKGLQELLDILRVEAGSQKEPADSSAGGNVAQAEAAVSPSKEGAEG